MGPKSSERLRRATTVGNRCEVLTDDQPLPDLNNFYSLTETKKVSRTSSLSIAWYIIKPLYLAGGLTEDTDKCTVISAGEVKEAPAYRASHEEAAG